MKSIYFLSRHHVEENRYYLHSEECPFLQAAGKRIYLGRFRSPGEALAFAMEKNREVALCRFCQKGSNKGAGSRSDRIITEGKEFISTGEINDNWDSMLVCCIN